MVKLDRSTNIGGHHVIFAFKISFGFEPRISMELFPVLGSLPHGGAFIGPLLSSFPPAVRVTNSCLFSARAVVREANTESTSTSASTSFVPKWRHSKSFLARKSAIVEVQQSSDLISSLERSVTINCTSTHLLFEFVFCAFRLSYL